MPSLKLVIVLATIFLVTSYAKEETPKNRDKRQQIPYHARRGARPPPYAVQMEPIVQYSQRDPLYNPLINSKSDDVGTYEEHPLSYYPGEPEPIIEIIIKESNESLPTPVPPAPSPTARPTKEPVQVYYVKYEKKGGYGEKSRVVYDPPVRALTPVEEHEEIKPSHRQEEPPQPVTPPPSEPTTTLRAIIRPESETYHSGSSGIRVTFGTDQLPPNNHNKRSDIEKSAPAKDSKPHPIASAPPGAPKRQHGPYQPLQPVPQRVPPAFPQQRVVNSFQPPLSLAPQQPQSQQQQQLPLKFLPQRQQQSSPALPQRNQPQRPQQLPVPNQGLPDLSQRPPSNPFGTPHRISINHPQQPGFPPTLSVSHQSVHLQNQPLGPIQPNFNIERKPPQLEAQPPAFSHLEQEKQRYHEQRRQQDALKQREHQRQREQQRLQEHRRLVELQRQFDQQRQVEQQRQADQQRQVEQHRHVEQHRQVEQQRLANQQRLVDQQQLAEQQRYADQQRLVDEQRLLEQQRIIAEQQRHQERQRLQDQQRIHEQRRRKQEQEQRLLQEQQYRTSLKYNQAIPSQGGIPIQPQIPNQKPEGEIFKAVPKLEQHYAIRENPIHPGPFPPNPIQLSPFPESSLNQFQSPHQLNNLQDSRQISGGQSNRVAINEVPRHIQQQPSESHQVPTNHHQQTFSPDSLRQHQQRLPQYQQQQWQQEQQAFWRRFPSQEINNNNNNNNNDNGIQKSQTIYATPVSVSSEFSSPAGSKTSFRNPVPYPTTTATTITTTTTTTTTEAPTTTTTLSPKSEAKIKENIANLPDEVPDDIREQLLSSGILGNADIQILDYDKVGGIPIEKLPPEALANFYGAGGASAVAASEPVPSILKRTEPLLSHEEDSASSGSSSPGVVASISKDELPDTESTIMGSSTKFEQATLRPGGVEMKVVRFDPSTEQGRAVAEQHIRTDATTLEPVTVGPKNLDQYNRYLPLKVSGASFPIPNVPELEGRKITSVVVLAPVDYRFQEKEKGLETREDRKLDDDVQAVRFINGETLKQLVKKPTEDNYKKWLEQESLTEPQKQSVVLLITTPSSNQPVNDKEIFMYDVNSKSVSKMAGDLSSAFVDAAESNSDSTDSFDDFSTY